MIRIIDNKRIDLTDSEFKMYQSICKSYDKANFKGADLFKGLFETDKKGRIIYLIPPKTKYTSMEVYMFLVNIMVHQHLGDACNNVEAFLVEARKVIDEGKQIIKELKSVEKKQK